MISGKAAQSHLQCLQPCLLSKVSDRHACLFQTLNYRPGRMPVGVGLVSRNEGSCSLDVVKLYHSRGVGGISGIWPDSHLKYVIVDLLSIYKLCWRWYGVNICFISHESTVWISWQITMTESIPNAVFKWEHTSRPLYSSVMSFCSNVFQVWVRGCYWQPLQIN